MHLRRNFVPGRTFRGLEDFSAQLLAWQREIADQRTHGTVFERPTDRFAFEEAHLVPTGTQPGFLASLVRERVVAEDPRSTP